MYIGIDIRSLSTKERTGVQEYTYELLNALFSIDQNNEYFLLHNYPKSVALPFSEWHKNRIHFVRSPFPKKILTAAEIFFRGPELDTLIRKTSGISSLDFFFSPNLNFTNLSSATKHILTIHDLTFNLFPHFFTHKQRVWHRLTRPQEQCRRAQHILAPSENTKRDIVQHLGIASEKITVISPALSTNFITNERALSIENVRKKYFLPDTFILFIGTIEPRKNISGLIEAFERIGSTNASLVIAGARGWNNDDVFNRIARSSRRDRIHYLGYVPAEDKAALYRTASVFAYPSFYEGFGFPVLEAMASGVPVVTSNRSSIPEITADAAYLINPHQPEQLAQAIRSLLTNPTLRERQIKNGFTRAKRFTWQTAAEQWLTLLTAKAE